FAPICRGVCTAESKCTPSSTWSTPTSSNSSAGHLSTAMSSPAGTGTRSEAFCCDRNHAMKSNSPGMSQPEYPATPHPKTSSQSQQPPSFSRERPQHSFCRSPSSLVGEGGDEG